MFSVFYAGVFRVCSSCLFCMNRLSSISSGDLDLYASRRGEVHRFFVRGQGRGVQPFMHTRGHDWRGKKHIIFGRFDVAPLPDLKAPA